MLGRLEALSNLCGVSGDEGRVRAYIRKELSPLGLDMHTDTLGNLIVHRPGAGRRVMICAHMDEVGMLVTGIQENGRLSYAAAGLDPRVVVSKRVTVGKNRIPGVIGCKAIHLQSDEEFKKTFPHKELSVDIGAKDKEDAGKYVQIGDYIGFTTRFSLFGDGLMKGKALDDRIGCVIVMELLKNTYSCDFTAVFTVQEEVGSRGAHGVVQRVRPEICLVIEGTTANDMPDIPRHRSVTRLGAGPAISIMDQGTLVKEAMLKALQSAAAEGNIPWQLRQGTAGFTDGGAVHTAAAGCVSGGLSVPCRYIHSPVSVAAVSDLENTYRLADAFMQNRKFDEVIK